LGAVILGAILLDLTVNCGLAMMFLLRKFALLVEWMAFWR
jgi:hypothetical protein